MLCLFVALVAAASAAAAPSSQTLTAPAGCPNGGVGVGGQMICPATGSCEYTDLTATLYEPGSCTPAGVGRIGMPGYCFNAFTNGASFNCSLAAPDFVQTATVGGVLYANCVELKGDGILCHGSFSDSAKPGYSGIGMCCKYAAS